MPFPIRNLKSQLSSVSVGLELVRITLHFHFFYNLYRCLNQAIGDELAYRRHRLAPKVRTRGSAVFGFLWMS